MISPKAIGAGGYIGRHQRESSCADYTFANGEIAFMAGLKIRDLDLIDAREGRKFVCERAEELLDGRLTAFSLDDRAAGRIEHPSRIAKRVAMR